MAGHKYSRKILEVLTSTMININNYLTRLSPYNPSCSCSPLKSSKTSLLSLHLASLPPLFLSYSISASVTFRMSIITSHRQRQYIRKQPNLFIEAFNWIEQIFCKYLNRFWFWPILNSKPLPSPIMAVYRSFFSFMDLFYDTSYIYICVTRPARCVRLHGSTRRV